jgi:hypothetical protein
MILPLTSSFTCFWIVSYVGAETSAKCHDLYSPLTAVEIARLDAGTATPPIMHVGRMNEHEALEHDSTRMVYYPNSTQ